ncbi:MAG: GIY-YIG nuclease family protein [Oleispira sp.]|nr:GIY-YIG nuclease family protein [Oleispira sp.]
MTKQVSSWSLYLIRTNKGSLYTGITTDVVRRFSEHQGGGIKAAKFLKGKGPLLLEFQIEVGDHSTALKLEYKVKRLLKSKKEQLIKSPHTFTEIFSEHLDCV